MSNLHLVTGHHGEAHVTANDTATFNKAVLGTGTTDCVLPGTGLSDVGTLGAVIENNNTISITPGHFIMQGRYVRLTEAASLTIENGTQAKYRKDLIVARYSRNVSTGVEDVVLAVIKGTEASAEEDAAVPEATYGSIYDGATHEMALFAVNISGLTISSIDFLYNSMGQPMWKNPTGELNMYKKKIYNLATPTADADAVNKYYADSLIKNLVGGTDVQILYGTAEIPYSATKEKSVIVNFSKAFAQKPVVITSQVFNGVPLVVLDENITLADFKATVQEVGESGSRKFSWIAIGHKYIASSSGVL